MAPDVAGVEGDAGLFPKPGDDLQAALDMGAGFDMDGDDIGAGGGEIGEIGIDRVDHQMHVERFRAVPTQGFDDRWADGQIGNKMAVHHIDMHPIGAGRVDGRDLGAQLGEIGRQNTGRDQGRDRGRDERREGVWRARRS